MTLTRVDSGQFAGGIVGCAAGAAHRLEPTDEEIILAYLEPTSTIGAAAQRMLGSISIVAPLPNDALVRELRNAIAEGASAKAEVPRPICGIRRALNSSCLTLGINAN